MSTAWDLLEAFVVRVPSVNVATGEEGPAARMVVATEARAREICAGHPSRTYRRATEADLSPAEIAHLRRAATEAKAAATSSKATGT